MIVMCIFSRKFEQKKGNVDMTDDDVYLETIKDATMID